jgi:hypothetical protein
MRRPAGSGTATHASIWQYLTDNLDFFEAPLRPAHPSWLFCGNAVMAASRIGVSMATRASDGY